MCILCASRKWCRRGAAMLPWLVIPLVGLWSLSGLLLPPRLRIELTSPRLACILVLFATLFWYEIIVPRLSLWRVRHSARLRERRLSQAIEFQKLRRSATRRCRNCLNPYRDQNPGSGGRFMCANCGHVSKRPILDLGTDHAGNWVGRCSTENVGVSASKLLLVTLSYVRWAWRKAVMIGSSREDCSSDKDSKGFSSKKEESGDNLPASRGEKARRKAEEKRQARLEKEMLEEEERKQREEVTRLVEERRKLRDEMLEAEKESLRRSASAGKKESRKGAEKRRQETMKEKDKGSSKSNSDCEEIEKRASREREGKHAFDKKSENERRVSHKTVPLDRTKFPFQLSPRSFRASASVMKANKPANGFDLGQISGNRKDAQSTLHATRKTTLNGDDRKIPTNIRRLVELDIQPRPATQKRSWLQLFTRSTAVSPCSDTNSTNSLNQSQSVQTTDHRMSPDYSVNCPFGSPPVSRVTAEYVSPFFTGSTQGLISDDADVFEDPCFVPDPISMLTPVSESLNNFPLDLGPGFVANDRSEEPRLMKKGSASADASKPSPIESPLSRLRVLGERHSVPGKLSWGKHGSSNADEPGGWQLWGSPLSQNGLGLVGGANWLSHIGQNKSSKEDAARTMLLDPLASLVAKETNFVPDRQVPQGFHMGNYQNGGMCSPRGQLQDSTDLWVQRTLFHTLPADGDNCTFTLSQMDNILLNGVGCDTPNGSASSENPELSPTISWSKRGCNPHGLQDEGSPPLAGSHAGGLFAASHDVQPVWSFN